jgi:1,4-alpha-glucan branching enzyme
VLHAHLPFVRHPEHPEFLEEDWLYEAITEVYLPLISVFTRLQQEGLRPRLAINISPTLCEMLADPLLQTRYASHLENLLALAEKELERTRSEAPEFHPTARLYHDNLLGARALWEKLDRNLVRGFGALQEAGAFEIITCGATHGFLPLISTNEARRAQVEVAVANYRKHFGRRPRGIWFPECAYETGLETYLPAVGIEYFIADTHAVLYGNPRPRYGVYAPVRCPNGVVVFGRDLETGMQVWSSIIGYPGDPFYREFYRDIGWDAPLEYLLPHLHADGRRRHLGLKYHRVTGREVPLGHKQAYDPAAARERAYSHAEHFVGERIRQAERLTELLEERAPHIVSPYDAELFGHWWFEGPQFLELVFRRLDAARGQIEAITPGDYLDASARLQTQQPAPSSWGAGGYFKVWLNEKNSWLYPHQHAAERRMTALANRYGEEPLDDLTRRALNQAGRELLLAQSSDWAFQIYQDTTVEYATRRFRAHVSRFRSLADEIEMGAIDEARLAEVERRDNIFAELDYRTYRT